MNKNEKYSVRKYDSLAQNYDASFDGRFTVKFKVKILEMCEVSDGGSVLDVGCGNGNLINALNQKGKIQACGMDISPNMIDECRKRYGDIEFMVSNGEDIPFDSASFDVLTICCVLHHLNNPQRFFVEAQRVLKPGGTLIVGDPWFPFGIRQIADWIVSPLLKAGDNKIFSHKRLKGLFTDGGFAITDIYKKGSIQIIMGRKL
jgi:ubiquinone/menaquinone biosynthesis C-methylase UbiE